MPILSYIIDESLMYEPDTTIYNDTKFIEIKFPFPIEKKKLVWKYINILSAPTTKIENDVTNETMYHPNIYGGRVFLFCDGTTEDHSIPMIPSQYKYHMTKWGIIENHCNIDFDMSKGLNTTSPDANLFSSSETGFISNIFIKIEFDSLSPILDRGILGIKMNFSF